MVPDPHMQIRHRFEMIIGEARRNAVEQEDMDTRSLKLEKLSAEQQVVTLYKAKQLIKLQAEGLEKKEYYRLDRFNHLIPILYLSRLICLKQDDERAVRDGILLNVKEQHIDLLLSKAKEQLEPFSLEDYLANRYNVVFYELDEKPATTSAEDYQSIRTWQTNRKVSCVKMEFNSFRDHFNQAAKDEIVHQDNLRDETKQLQNIFNNAVNWKAKKLIDELQKLKGLSGIIFPDNIADFHHSMVLFLQGNNFINRLRPEFFETATKNIEANRVSAQPIFGLSLFMYFRWLQHLSLEKNDDFDEEECCFDTLFANTFEKGVANKDVMLSSIKKKIRDRSFSHRQYERVIIQGMEAQRKLFNKLPYPHYFTFLEHKEILRNCFIDDCLRSLSLEVPVEALIQMISLNENIQFYSEELSLLKHNPLVPSADQLAEIAIMMETLCHMAPGPELINRFLDIKELIKNKVYNERIPLFFICENANDLFSGIFVDAISNFKNLIENISTDEKGIFITTLLRDISYMETINGIKCHKKNIFFKQFKHILKEELKNVHEMQSFKHPESNDNISKTESSDNLAFSFGYHPGLKELKPVMDALQLKINLFKDPSDVAAFMEVFTCRDLSKVSRTFKLGCQTNQFKSVMDYLADYSTNFNPASIEKSGLFISKRGKPITANCLNASNTDSMKGKHAIQNIFMGKH